MAAATVGVLAFGMEQPPDGLLVTMRCMAQSPLAKLC